VNVALYIFVFLASLLVDIVPFIGPPAWIVMVFFQVKFGLNIWIVLALGVTGSAIGRYLYSCYINRLAAHLIRPEKNNDLRFIGSRLSENGWKVQFFVLLYTLLPLPSTPLFTAAGVAGVKTLSILPSFFIGKFCSDSVMVITGNYVARDLASMTNGFFSPQAVAGAILGLVLICFFLFTDWQKLLLEKKFRISVHIWK
jgi:membrane protein YqaA with SNARE-associated domain